MYKLFVLGQLMDHEMSGYELRKALATIVGTEQTISYGVLYPLLAQLAAANEITVTTVDGGQRPKKIAAITAAGKRHFAALVVAPVAVNKQSQLLFQIKCNFLHLLSAAEQRVILTDFQKFCHDQLDDLQHSRDYVLDHPRMVPQDVTDT